MQNEYKHQINYTPPSVEVQTFRVEEGFADSVTWQNHFTVDPAETPGEVDLFLWTDQTRSTPTNANEAFEGIDWSDNNNAMWNIQ